ncbi:MAG: 3'-5' exonuclease, partial [bacterium]
IEVVNAVFEGLSEWEPEAGPGMGLRASAVAAFAGEWQKHESARQGEGSGFAALLEYVPRKRGGADESAGEGEDGADDPAEFEAVAKVLGQIQPTQRGLTAAVLVRGNHAGRTCVDVLRRQLPDAPVVHEGTGGIVDNPVVTVLLSLVRYAAHPGDTLALRHLQMSPLASSPEMSDLNGLPRKLLALIHEDGFAGMLRQWGGRLGDLDAFSRQRLRELLAAAEQFDAIGESSADGFAQYIEAYQIKASTAAGTVRVMTIHQAKGLGFDVVIVPFSARSKSFEKPGEYGLLAGDNWVFDPPCSQALEAAGGKPLRALEAARADANFSQLCVLYVALTRAQQALYMIVPEKGKSSVAVREADLLRERLRTNEGEVKGLCGLKRIFATGDPAWFEKFPKQIQSEPKSQPSQVQVTFSPEVPRREPSKDHAGSRSLPAAWLFGEKSGDVLAFGSAIHRLFQRIEWFEDTNAESIIAEWRKEDTGTAALLDEVAQQFRSCLAKEEVRRMLARPAGAARVDVWREAPFNVVINVSGQRQIMAGRFDRLVVERDACGLPVKATVFDFKSNIIEKASDLNKAADGYASQMDDYARAASRLLGLERERISTVLLFTRSGWARLR